MPSRWRPTAESDVGDRPNAIAELVGVSAHGPGQMILELFLEDSNRGRYRFAVQTETVRTVSLIRR